MYKIILTILFFLFTVTYSTAQWQSKHVRLNADRTLKYFPDEHGNTIPDFSNVGYHHGEEPVPFVPVVKIVSPVDSNNLYIIQSAIDEVSAMPPNASGFRGAILMMKGVYKIAGTIKISSSGIVLRGEGDETVLIAIGNKQHNLIQVSGTGNLTEVKNTRENITDDFVAVGSKCFNIRGAGKFKVGDNIIVSRPGTSNWIHDLKMDSIETRDTTTKQWLPEEFDLKFERTVTAIQGNKLYIDNPIVMQMESKYGGGMVYKYTFDGRLQEVGLENFTCVSAYTSDVDEDHGWNAILLNRIENGWVKNVTSKFFGYACVNLGGHAKNITVDNCKYLQPKSQITGGRRYSFNNDGQQNLVMNSFASEGRHDYVTGARVCGPNVFYHCRSEKAKADIGPHHRWAAGTLYDNIITDGEINVQDRGNWGTGHGWSGVTQVIWNCSAAGAAILDPWVSGKNYVIGLKANQLNGRLKGRKLTEWEKTGSEQLIPSSLYEAQLAARQL